MPSRRSSGQRILLAAGAAAALQVGVVSVLDGATRSGYDPWRDWISQLALGPRGWLGIVDLAGCGAWLFAYAMGLRRGLSPSRSATWAVRLVRICAGGFVMIAMVPIDPGLGYPPGTAAVHTPTGYLHQAAALVLFASGAVAAVLLGHCVGTVRAAVVVAAVMGVSFVAACVLVTLDVTGVVTGTPSGLCERVALFTGLGWIGFVGLRLAR